MAAAVLGLMTYAETRLHRKMVLEVACLGVADGRTALMGVLYDEILRCMLDIIVCCICCAHVFSMQERMGRAECEETQLQSRNTSRGDTR